MVWLLRLLLLGAAGAGLTAWWTSRRKRAIYHAPETLIRALPEAVQATRTPRQTDDGRIAVQISWTLEDTLQAVYQGIHPDHIDTPATIKSTDDTSDGVQSVYVTNLNPDVRHFFRVQFNSGASYRIGERLIPIHSIANFRDIGGYVTYDSRTVKWNRVYRAATLANISDDDLTRLSELGIQMVCDLRSPEEVEDAPDRLPDGADYRHLPAHNTESRLVRIAQMMFNPASIANMLPDLYTRVMIDQNGEMIGRIFRYMADADNHPIVIHCTAGKDRTGLIITLLLLTLGVPEDVVIADYSLSNQFYAQYQESTRAILQQLSLVGVRESDLHPLFVADPAYLETALAHIRQHYGDVETYLRTQAGLDDAVFETLRANLLDD